MLKDVKCEVRQFVFQRIETIHSVDNLPDPLPRIDEVLVENRGGSHLHQTEVADPIVDAKTFAEAVLEAENVLTLIDTEFKTITPEQIAGFKSLLAVGQTIEFISKLSGFSVEAIKKSLSV